MENLAQDFTKEVMAVGLLLPIVWYLLKKHFKQQAEHNAKNFEQQAEHNANILKTMEDGFKKIELAVWKRVLDDPAEIRDIVTKYIQSAMEPKLDYIEDRLEKNNLVWRKEKIKDHIKSELIRFSKIYYIDPLKRYNTKIWLLWTWIWDNYPMEEFLEEVYDVVFWDWDIQKKRYDIRTLMRSYLTELINELELQLKNY